MDALDECGDATSRVDLLKLLSSGEFSKLPQNIRILITSRPEKDIVVVAHADCLRYITEGHNSLKYWANTEVGGYTFKCEESEDEESEAWLVPVEGEVVEIGAASELTY